jgi:hypothetical protein
MDGAFSEKYLSFDDLVSDLNQQFAFAHIDIGGSVSEAR